MDRKNDDKPMEIAMLGKKMMINQWMEWGTLVSDQPISTIWQLNITMENNHVQEANHL
jgi:hypothetical protein